MLTAFAFGLVDRADLPAGITGIELVEPVSDSGEVIVDAVRINGVIVVVDRDVSDIVLSKGDIGEHADHSRVSAKTGEIFRQHYRYTFRFDLIQHVFSPGQFLELKYIKNAK